MAEIKGIERIDKIINKFTAPFGVTANLGIEFQAFCDSMTIDYTLFFDEDSTIAFIDDATKRYPEINADIFLWAFMHELGHCMTENMWTEAEKEYFWEQKDAINDAEIDMDEANNWYHACPDEFFATRWAGEYMLNHPRKMQKFWKKLHAAIMKMYKENGLI